jgi:hypothetical protein
MTRARREQDVTQQAMTHDKKPGAEVGAPLPHSRWEGAARARRTPAATLLGLALGVLGASAGCAGPADRPAGASAAPEHGAVVTLGVDAQRIYERTLARDGAPSCAELTADVAAPVPALVEITERVIAPPGSGIRAAECLLETHALEVEPTLTAWVTHEATLGFGLLVLGRLDALEPALAERLARAALAGELAERARPRIARSERLHGLLAPGTAEEPGPR